MTQPKHRPQRQTFLIHAGSTEVTATLPEWWGSLDSDVEAHSLRFDGDDGNWLHGDELPPALADAGCRVVDVVVSDTAALAHPSIRVGARVLLNPEPSNPEDPNAIAVWVEDASQHIGYLPRETAAETMSESRRRGAGYGAFVAGEHRDAESGERQGIKAFLAPGVVWARETT